MPFLLPTNSVKAVALIFYLYLVFLTSQLKYVTDKLQDQKYNKCAKLVKFCELIIGSHVIEQLTV